MIDTRTPQQIANDEQAEIPTQRYRAAYRIGKHQAQGETDENLKSIYRGFQSMGPSDCPAFAGISAAYRDEVTRRDHM